LDKVIKTHESAFGGVIDVIENALNASETVVSIFRSEYSLNWLRRMEFARKRFEMSLGFHYENLED